MDEYGNGFGCLPEIVVEVQDENLTRSCELVNLLFGEIEQAKPVYSGPWKDDKKERKAHNGARNSAMVRVCGPLLLALEVVLRTAKAKHSEPGSDKRWLPLAVGTMRRKQWVCFSPELSANRLFVRFRSSPVLVAY